MSHEIIKSRGSIREVPTSSQQDLIGTAYHLRGFLHLGAKELRYMIFVLSSFTFTVHKSTKRTMKREYVFLDRGRLL